jgi:hypothetical protein
LPPGRGVNEIRPVRTMAKGALLIPPFSKGGPGGISERTGMGCACPTSLENFYFSGYWEDEKDP